MVSKKARRYSAKKREAVLAEVHTGGVMAAADKHQVPQSRVSRWAKAAGVTREGSAKTSASACESTSDASRTHTP